MRDDLTVRDPPHACPSSPVARPVVPAPVSIPGKQGPAALRSICPKQEGLCNLSRCEGRGQEPNGEGDGGDPSCGRSGDPTLGGMAKAGDHAGVTWVCPLGPVIRRTRSPGRYSTSSLSFFLTGT
jgi:hypothetical protein